MPPSPTLTRSLHIRYALVAVAGAAALSVAACGSSNNATPSSTSHSAAATSSSAPAQPTGKDHVVGLIASVSGNTIQITEHKDKDKATVSFDPSTKISEFIPGQLSDVVAGSCIAVVPVKNSPTSSPTARRVLISGAKDGSCLGSQPKDQSGSSTPPTPPPGKPHDVVRGTVTSVNGNTILVSSTDPSSGAAIQTKVTVTSETKYTKRVVAEAGAIVAGKCLAALGTKDGSGVLQATLINLRAAHDGSCEHEEHHK